MSTLNELASAQYKGTQATMQSTKKLMDYCHIHSDATIRYCASQTQLHIQSDASYLSASKARSSAGRYFFLSDKFNPTSQTKHNGAVLLVVAILKMWWLPQQSRNWEACSSTPKRERYSEPHWDKWETHKGRRLWKQITPWHQASSTKPSNNEYPKTHTWVFIRLGIDANKNNS